MQSQSGDSYTDRRRWSDQFVNVQLDTLGSHYHVDPESIRIATTEQDFAGYDAIMPDGTTIGLRIRRAEKFDKHPNDFTVRLDQNRAGESELTKVKQGRPDAILYAHGIAADGIRPARLTHWRLLDCAVFRLAARHWFDGIDYHVTELKDAKFIVFDFAGFEGFGRFVIAEG